MQRFLDQPRQDPTHPCLHIRTAKEALLVIYATYLGHLPKITQRLSLAERQRLQSGCVYVSERDMSKSAAGERQLKRFTDGLKWSQSKNRDEFLFYEQQYERIQDGPIDPPIEWQPLVKQTYSITLNSNERPTQWHLTAYYTHATVGSLLTVNDIPAFKNLQVPQDMFTKSKDSIRPRPSKPPNRKPKAIHTYAPFPTSSAPITRSPREARRLQHRTADRGGVYSEPVSESSSSHSDDDLNATDDAFYSSGAGPALASSKPGPHSFVDSAGLAASDAYSHQHPAAPFDEVARGLGQGPGSSSSPRILRLAPIDALEGAQQYACARTQIDDLQLKALGTGLVPH